MAWLQPTGWEDPDGAWEDEVNAIDLDHSTRATCPNIPKGEYGGFLVLTFPSTIVTEFPLKLGSSDPPVVYDLDYFYEGAWHDKVEQYLDYDELFTSWAGPGVPVSAIRIRFRRGHFEPCDAYVFSVGFEITCPGPLHDFCVYFATASNFFYDLALTLEGVPVIGQYLSAPFEWLSERLAEARKYCCEASGWLLTLQDELREGLSWDTVKALIGEALGIEPYHMQSADFLIKHLIEEYFPSLYAFYLNPEGETARVLAAFNPDLYGLVYFPMKQIREWICEWLGIPLGFRDHPDEWFGLLIEAHAPWLVELYDDPMLFLNQQACERGSALCGLFVAPDKWVWAYIREFFDFPFVSYHDLPGGIWLWLADKGEEFLDTVGEALWKFVEKLLDFVAERDL